MQSKASYFTNNVASYLAGWQPIKSQFSKEVSEGASDNFANLWALLHHDIFLYHAKVTQFIH